MTILTYKNKMQISEKCSAGNYYMSKQKSGLQMSVLLNGKNSNVVLNIVGGTMDIKEQIHALSRRDDRKFR